MINDRCKPGDLALVVGGKSNLGKLVHVDHALPPDETRALLAFAPSYRGQGTLWGVVSKGLPFRILSMTTMRPTNSMEAVCPDNWLLPIRPDQLPEKEETDEDVSRVTRTQDHG